MFTLLSALCESLLTPEVNISLLSCKTLHCAPHPAANSVICAAVLSGFLCFHMLGTDERAEKWTRTVKLQVWAFKDADTSTSSHLVHC